MQGEMIKIRLFSENLHCISYALNKPFYAFLCSLFFYACPVLSYAFAMYLVCI